MTVAFEYSAKEFVKVYRKFLNWEWYTDVNTKTLFIHCLLRANWRAGEWHGIHYEAGEFFTSLPSLAQETGLTIRQARTSLARLISTGELSSRMSDNVSGKKISKGRIITVNNWDCYQTSDRQNVRQTTGKTSGKRQASDRQDVNQTTIDKEIYKNNRSTEKRKNIKKESSATRPSETVAAEAEETDALSTDPDVNNEDDWEESFEDPEETRRKFMESMRQSNGNL